MKFTFAGIPMLGCFVDQKGRVRKKVAEHKAADVRESDGRVSVKKVKGDPEVEPLPGCPVRLFGVGLRRHPDRVIEIGDGDVPERRRKGK